MTPPQLDDGPLVPLMVEGTIDADTLRQLFADLIAATRILGVREKDGPIDYTSADGPPLNVALERLLSGTTRAIQVRYRFDDYEWSDTVLANSAGFRVVRCRHETA